MVWDDVAVVCELFVADGAFPVLLNNLPVEAFAFPTLTGVPGILLGDADLRSAAPRA